MIVEKKLKHVVVCEDDAIQVRRLPSVSKLQGRVTLLGGRLAGRTPWRTQNEDWVRSGEALKVYKTLRPGLNAIDYDRYRWLNTVAVYYPNARCAQAILDTYAAATRVSYYDIFLCTERLVTHLWFPPCFAEWSDGASGNAHNSNWNDLYCDYPKLRLAISRSLGVSAAPNPEERTP